MHKGFLYLYPSLNRIYNVVNYESISKTKGAKENKRKKENLQNVPIFAHPCIRALRPNRNFTLSHARNIYKLAITTERRYIPNLSSVHN
jgi:hypothetical protein